MRYTIEPLEYRHKPLIYYVVCHGMLGGLGKLLLSRAGFVRLRCGVSHSLPPPRLSVSLCLCLSFPVCLSACQYVCLPLSRPLARQQQVDTILFIGIESAFPIVNR